jgi:hypothetical protein
MAKLRLNSPFSKPWKPADWAAMRHRPVARPAPPATLFAAVLLVTFAAGCGNGDDNDARPACVDVAVESCTLAHPPEYPILFDRIFVPKCASAGGACHGGMGQGGLTFVDANTSYDLLLATNQDGARVKPGNARCSEVVVRLDSIGHSWSMPPANPLDEETRCSIRRWIQMGASRMP